MVHGPTFLRFPNAYGSLTYELHTMDLGFRPIRTTRRYTVTSPSVGYIQGMKCSIVGSSPGFNVFVNPILTYGNGRASEGHWPTLFRLNISRERGGPVGLSLDSRLDGPC